MKKEKPEIEPNGAIKKALEEAIASMPEPAQLSILKRYGGVEQRFEEIRQKLIALAGEL